MAASPLRESAAFASIPRMSVARSRAVFSVGRKFQRRFRSRAIIGRKSAGSWLQAIAKAMGEVLGQKAGEMVKLSDKISSLAQEGKGLEGDAKADNAADMTAAQTEMQGVSQEYKLLTETISTVLKGIGEALSTMGRKQ